MFYQVFTVFSTLSVMLTGPEYQYVEIPEGIYSFGKSTVTHPYEPFRYCDAISPSKHRRGMFTT